MNRDVLREIAGAATALPLRDRLLLAALLLARADDYSEGLASGLLSLPHRRGTNA